MIDIEKSIQKVNENEVKKFVDNARKALESIGYLREEDWYETHEYIDYIEHHNKYTRYGIYDASMSILATDILENRGLWEMHENEEFEDCIEKVAKEVDITFLGWLKEMEYEEE